MAFLDFINKKYPQTNFPPSRQSQDLSEIQSYQIEKTNFINDMKSQFRKAGYTEEELNSNSTLQMIEANWELKQMGDDEGFSSDYELDEAGEKLREEMQKDEVFSKLLEAGNEKALEMQENIDYDSSNIASNLQELNDQEKAYEAFFADLHKNVDVHDIESRENSQNILTDYFDVVKLDRINRDYQYQDVDQLHVIHQEEIDAVIKRKEENAAKFEQERVNILQNAINGNKNSGADAANSLDYGQESKDYSFMDLSSDDIQNMLNQKIAASKQLEAEIEAEKHKNQDALGLTRLQRIKMMTDLKKREEIEEQKRKKERLVKIAQKKLERKQKASKLAEIKKMFDSLTPELKKKYLEMKAKRKSLNGTAEVHTIERTRSMRHEL